jgi:hypothetical protein
VIFHTSLTKTVFLVNFLSETCKLSQIRLSVPDQVLRNQAEGEKVKLMTKLISLLTLSSCKGIACHTVPHQASSSLWNSVKYRHYLEKWTTSVKMQPCINMALSIILANYSVSMYPPIFASLLSLSLFPGAHRWSSISLPGDISHLKVTLEILSGCLLKLPELSLPLWPSNLSAQCLLWRVFGFSQVVVLHLLDDMKHVHCTRFVSFLFDYYVLDLVSYLFSICLLAMVLIQLKD